MNTLLLVNDVFIENEDDQGRSRNLHQNIDQLKPSATSKINKVGNQLQVCVFIRSSKLQKYVKAL